MKIKTFQTVEDNSGRPRWQWSTLQKSLFVSVNVFESYDSHTKTDIFNNNEVLLLIIAGARASNPTVYKCIKFMYYKLMQLHLKMDF